jgi:hypothetical protein
MAWMRWREARNPRAKKKAISGAKAKNLTSRHPMNNSHVADPSQAFYTTPTQTL